MSGGVTRTEIISNQYPSGLAHVTKVSDCTWQLAEALHKPIIRKFEKQKVYSSFKDNIWGADLADLKLLILVSAIFYQMFIFSTNDSPLKTVKNVFYFI